MTEFAFLIETPTLGAQYETMIRKLAQSLWRSEIYRPTFVSSMNKVIKDGITRAWYQGLADVGLKPEDMTDREKEALGNEIGVNQKYVAGLANFIHANNQNKGGKWRMVSNRIKLWGNRYNNARNKAKVMGQNDPKLMWRLGKTEQHCKSCSALNGKVKRSSYWSKVQIFPQNAPNDKLECGGWKCDCSLEPTDEPLSKGRLPGEN